MSIRKLEAACVRRIKSGQVIVDVRSAVKELVENAIDAGATRVEVRLAGGGLDLVQVADNGSGIAAADRPLFALGHHTSKIDSYGALERLRTFGFRGEALHALCEAAGEVTVLTRCKDERRARLLTMDRAGTLASDAEANAPQGTTISARALWSAHPVRRGFMQGKVKGDAKRIHDAVVAYALAYPAVSFALQNPPAKDLCPRPCASTAEALTEVFGPLLVDSLRPVDYTAADGYVRFTGFLPRPDAQKQIVLRRANDRFFAYVNRRPVDLPRLAKMLTSATRKWFAPEGEATAGKVYPFAVLMLEMGTDRYDVNVSPDKRKLYFLEEDLLLKHANDLFMSLYPLKSSAHHSDSDDKGDNEQDEDVGATQAYPSDAQDIVVDTTQPGGKRVQSPDSDVEEEPRQPVKKRRITPPLPKPPDAGEDIIVKVDMGEISRLSRVLVAQKRKPAARRPARISEVKDMSAALACVASSQGVRAVGAASFKRTGAPAADWVIVTVQDGEPVAAGSRWLLSMFSWLRSEEVSAFNCPSQKANVKSLLEQIKSGSQNAKAPLKGQQ
eukprot:m51a1_g2922 putative dna mismatch repair protein pms1-like (557) ;mRNA; f:540448-543190